MTIPRVPLFASFHGSKLKTHPEPTVSEGLALLGLSRSQEEHFLTRAQWFVGGPCLGCPPRRLQSHRLISPRRREFIKRPPLCCHSLWRTTFWRGSWAGFGATKTFWVLGAPLKRNMRARFGKVHRRLFLRVSEQREHILLAGGGKASVFNERGPYALFQNGARQVRGCKGL